MYEAGQSYLQSMTRVKKILCDFSVHFTKEQSNWNSCNGDPLTNAFDLFA